MNFLKQQYRARVNEPRSWEYPVSVVGPEFRADNGKLKMSATGEHQLEYLQRLLKIMVKHDAGRSEDAAPGLLDTAEVVRSLPEISSRFTSKYAASVKKEHKDKLLENAAPVDDPLLLELLGKYKGKVFWEFDVRPKNTYKVLDVQYDSKGAAGTPYWEATCAIVKYSPESSTWELVPEHVVAGTKGQVKAGKLHGFMLVDLADESNPKHLPWVDQYIAAHESRPNSSY